MRTVRILRNYKYPDLLRQTPNESGFWADTQFFIDESGTCDYAIILNGVSNPCEVQCASEHVWAIMQEPPTEFLKRHHKGFPVYHRIFTSDTSLIGARYTLCQPALPWHVAKTYDQLVTSIVPEKSKRLSWVTSNLTNLKGHRDRMKFLHEIQKGVDLDVYGRGINYIKDKWDGIAPYKYSLAIENFQNDYYWSEKLSDCFLSWTMPIYFGCKKIMEYFPAESMVVLDDIGEKHIISRIREIIASNLWKKNIDAIAYARNLVLKKYQMFPFITTKIQEWEANSNASQKNVRSIYLPKAPEYKLPLRIYAARYIKQKFQKLINH